MKKQDYLQMSNHTLLALGLSFLLVSSSAMADIGQVLVMCKRDKAVRTLRIEETQDRCKAIYTKQGVDQVIGSSQNKTACEDYIGSVRKNLEGGKWTCRDVKESRVSNLNGDEVP